ncbi:MAG: zinc ABC transporter substrate-binding protein, partial [Planctomycetia bacterium]|nr:zinc ABC transporter substrate-binding protein [Planctomycetia bacterium]
MIWKRLLSMFLAIASGLSIVGVVSCFSPDVPRDGKLRVCVSFELVRDFVTMIAQDKVETICLVPPGTEAHHWEPTPGDMAKIAKSGVFIYNGAGMEHWVQKALESLKNHNLHVLEASKGISLEGSHACPCGAEHHDHHHDHAEHHD